MRKVTFANLITRSGKSMSRIAREADLSLSMISRIKGGTRLPRLHTIKRLSEVLGVPASDVMDALEDQHESAA